jgi:hypothetical protein
MAERSDAFDCRATAAVLRSGGTIALAGHATAVMSVLSLHANGPEAWIACVAVLVWCAVVYLAIRVKLDAQFFELLAAEPSSAASAEQLDDWLAHTGFRKNHEPRTIPERRRGALRLWRMLVAAVVLQIVLLLLILLRWLA